MKQLLLLLGLFFFVNSSAQVVGISEFFNFSVKSSKELKPENLELTGTSSLQYFEITPYKVSKKKITTTSESVGVSDFFQFSIRKQKPTTKEPNIIASNKIKTITQDDRYHALIIAIDDYKNNSPELRDLSNPIKDAESLKEILSSNFIFEKDNITFLKNPNRSQILETLDELAYTLKDHQNLLIYFAGHGKWDEQINVGYWLPADASFDSKSNWISNSTLTDYIAGIKTKHTLLISDACFSGSIFKSRNVSEGLSELGFARIYKMPSRKAMTSGSLNIVPDKSVFMHYLLKRLNNLEEEYITSKQLFYQIETAVINNSNNIPQFGVIQNAGDEGGDFIFIQKK